MAQDLEKGPLLATAARHEAREVRNFAHDGNASNWMAFLDDDVPLTMLTIPGTHDSCAYTNSYPFVATQRMDILAQLNTGIRYFDLRCGVYHDSIEMVHGPSRLGLTLHSILEVMYHWLDAHPSEALIVQIKKDRDDDKSNSYFAQAICNMILDDRQRWRIADTVPLLGALRGRIQLFRRFEGPGLHEWGLDVTEWLNNPIRPFTITTNHDVYVTIQDHYTFRDPKSLPQALNVKGGVVRRMIHRAASNVDSKHWFVNFTSAYEINLRHQLTPRDIAVGGYHRFRWVHGMNILLRGTLTELGRGKCHLGIVAMDFPELATNDLVAALIRTNFDVTRQGRTMSALVVVFGLVFLSALLWVVIFLVLPRIQRPLLLGAV